MSGVIESTIHPRISTKVVSIQDELFGFTAGRSVRQSRLFSHVHSPLKMKSDGIHTSSAELPLKKPSPATA